MFDLQVEVHCTNPDIFPVYRIFVDNELIVERTWPHEKYIYIKEQLLLNLEPGQHTFVLSPYKCPQSTFKIDNPRLNDVYLSNFYQLSFRFEV